MYSILGSQKALADQLVQLVLQVPQDPAALEPPVPRQAQRVREVQQVQPLLWLQYLPLARRVRLLLRVPAVQRVPEVQQVQPLLWLQYLPLARRVRLLLRILAVQRVPVPRQVQFVLWVQQVPANLADRPALAGLVVLFDPECLVRPVRRVVANLYSCRRVRSSEYSQESFAVPTNTNLRRLQHHGRYNCWNRSTRRDC
jgi:hypothetical protein